MTLLREIIRGRTKLWFALAGFWLAAGVLSALHWQLFYTGRDPYTWWELYRVKIALWYVWGFLTPLILCLGAQFPLGRGTSIRHTIMLLPISVIFTLAYLALYSALLIANMPTAPGLFQSPRAMFTWVIGAHSTWYFLAFWATIGIEHAVAFYRRYHERQVLTSQLEAKLAEAQLAVLRSQLQPHFLFNTLHSIMALINQNETKQAKDMLAGLSDLLRHALDHVRQHEVPLREELDLVRRYVEIERIRFADRLTVEWQLEPDAEMSYVPSFVLQPLVENAIRHGIEQRPGPGRLLINCRREDTSLLVSVSDNGKGITVSGSDGLRNGHGLGDLRARLDVLYPNKHSLEITPLEGVGTIVRLVLPYHTAPQQEPPG